MLAHSLPGVSPWCPACATEVFMQRQTAPRLSRAARPLQTSAALSRKASHYTGVVDQLNGSPLMPHIVESPEGSPVVLEQPSHGTSGSSSAGIASSEEERDESRDFAIAMAQLAHETKGNDIMVLHVAPLIYWTSYMVFVTVFSRPQLGAVLGKMEKEAAEKWDRQLNEGAHPSRTEWEVLDLGDVVVHVFTAEQREYFDLETFYGAAEEIALPFTTESFAEQRDADIAWAQKL